MARRTGSSRLHRLALRSALCAVLLGAAAAQAMNAGDLFTQVSPSVWRIRTYDKEGLPLAIGSAVVIGPQRLVTNCHVLRKASRFVVARDKLSFPGTLDMWDAPRDLCEVKAAIGDAPAVVLAESAALAVGQDVYALGSPEGLELTLSAGLISSLRRDAQEHLTLIQTSAPISPGSSGGGLFDGQGRLVGVTTMVSAARGAQNLNFALPAEWVRDLPQRHAEARAQAASAPVGVVAGAASGASGTRVPYLDESGQARYRRYLTEPAPKAFAISDNGFYGAAASDAAGSAPLTDAKERALQSCAVFAQRLCKVYAVDDAVVFRP
ncbi:MAG: S1C family serine protease [Burkholderiales bacterium]